MKQRNPRMGCPKITLQINHAFDTGIDKDIVRRILEKYYKPGHNGGNGPSWLTFVGHMKDSLWSVDLFRCESITLKSHWVMVILDQYSRRIIGFAVKSGSVDGITLCCSFNKIISGMNVIYKISLMNFNSIITLRVFIIHWMVKLRKKKQMIALQK